MNIVTDLQNKLGDARTENEALRQEIERMKQHLPPCPKCAARKTARKGKPHPRRGKPSDIMVDREPSETEAQVAWIVPSMLKVGLNHYLTQHRKEAYAAGHKAGFLKAIAILRDELKAIK